MNLEKNMITLVIFLKVSSSRNIYIKFFVAKEFILRKIEERKTNHK